MIDCTLELAAASNNPDAMRDAARTLGGAVYCDDREAWDHLPFRSLMTVVTDDFPAVERIGDVGVYVVCRRLIKAGSFRAAGLFPLVRKPELSHEEADAYWRDVHAPLALDHHGFMSHYSQLSVVLNISGRAFDGFAVCGFESVEDLRERFYTTAQSVGVIAADVAGFADTRNSPRRLVVTEARF